MSMDEFVSEPIEPEPGVFDAAAMARGEPGLPAAFRWRGRRFVLAHVLARWKTSTPDRGELYLRRHWFEIACGDGTRMKLYCERQARNRTKPARRWWLYAIVSPASPASQRGG